MHTNKSRGWLWVLIVLVVVIIIGVVLWIVGVFSPSYYAVYLNTGDLYFGKMSAFSDTLHNAWYIQRDAQNQSLGLNDFSKVVWGSSGNLELNEKNVVWTTKLAENSQIIPVIEGKVVPPSQQPQPPLPQPKATTTTEKQ